MNVDIIVCYGKKRIYFLQGGYLCSGEKGIKSDVKNSTIVKHGFYEGQKTIKDEEGCKRRMIIWNRCD